MVGCLSASVVITATTLPIFKATTGAKSEEHKMVKMPLKQFYSEKKLCIGMNLGAK